VLEKELRQYTDKPIVFRRKTNKKFESRCIKNYAIMIIIVLLVLIQMQPLNQYGQEFL